MRSFSFLLMLLVTLASFAACASKDEPARNGVNDVKKACEVRAAWTNAGATKCINCVTSAPAAKCDCEQFKEFGGLCESQQNARHADPGCTVAVDDCTNACPKNDCTCIENCYGQAASCKQLSGSRDGCVADVCAQYCN